MFKGTFHRIDRIYKRNLSALNKASELLGKAGVQKVETYRVRGGFRVYYQRARLSGYIGEKHEGTRVKGFPSVAPVDSFSI